MFSRGEPFFSIINNYIVRHVKFMLWCYNMHGFASCLPLRVGLTEILANHVALFRVCHVGTHSPMIISLGM